MLTAIDLGDRSNFTDPRFYNIRWLELMNEISDRPRIQRFGAVL